MSVVLQAEFEPEYVQAGSHNPEHWNNVLSDAKQLLTRISTLQPLAQSIPCLHHSFIIIEFNLLKIANCMTDPASIRYHSRPHI